MESSRVVKKLTAGIKSKVRPAVVEIGLFGANTNCLDQSHLARRRSKFFKICNKLDQTGDESEGDVLCKTLVLTVAESRYILDLALGVKFVGILNLLGVSSGFALCDR
jgi:hypothetical protein